MAGSEGLSGPYWDLVCWRLAQAFASRQFARHRSTVQSLQLSSDEEDVLLALLAVEMSARPTIARALEWVAYWGTGVLHLPRQLRPRSIGPLQFPNAPFSFERAARLASDRLSMLETSPSAIARSWNGAGKSLRGFEFEHVLRVAMRRVLRMRRQENATGIVDRIAPLPNEPTVR